MPVRIYDIAKKLGLESKEVLIKAKELSIAAAKVPSSSLDKISAEWLEEEIIKTNPAVAARLAHPPVEEKPKAEHVDDKIVVIHAPEPEPEPEPAPEPEPVIEVSVPEPVATAPVAEVPSAAPAPTLAPDSTLSQPVAPAPVPVMAPAPAPVV
ncbi:MAG: translation initiation factor IF-2, partial [Verrucomicrobiota bacterium]